MSAAIPGNEWVGRVIDGKYALRKWLGSTGQSRVFLTESEDDPRRKAAIKLIAAESVDPEAYISGWAATGALSHPHLMHVSHSGRCQVDDRDLLYVVMEYADEVLSEILQERALTAEETGEMLKPVMDALGYLHERGFVHGRLKPSNIMVVDDGIKLSADGLLTADQSGEKGEALSIYDAPEGVTSPAADVWSLGVTLITALTQHPPAWNGSRGGDPVVPESIPRPFAEIAKACLRVDPSRRCSLGAVKVHLGSGEPIPEVSPIPRSPAPDREAVQQASGKGRIWVLGGGGVILLAVIAAVLMQGHPGQPSPPTESEQTKAPVAAKPSPSVIKEPSGPVTAAPLPAETAQAAPAATASQPQAGAESTAPATVAAPAPVQESGPVKGATAKGGVAQQVLPEVPRKASGTIQGRVKVGVRVQVDPQGKVADADFESQGPSRYFADLALKAARGWTFTPAQVNGQAAASTWILRFEFRTSGVTVTPVEVSP